MNMSKVISHIKMMLSLNNIVLPFKDDITGETTPTENVIRDVLTTATIPVYSQYSPWLREGVTNLNTLKLIDRRLSIYLLPAYLTTTSVMYVADVSLPLYGDRGIYSGIGYGDGFIAPIHGLYTGAKGVAASQASMMLMGQMRHEPSFEYLGENKIRLYGFPRTTVRFRLACEHEPNGETIPAGCYDSFLQLAMLDTKMFLWNTLKLYDKIPSAHGQIDLRIEDFQQAESERGTVLDSWKETFHLDMDWQTYM